MDRVTEGLLRCAVDRGHTVHVALERRKVGPTTEGDSLFDALERESTLFTFESLSPRPEPWLRTATRLRCAIDYLRYFEPDFAEAEMLRDRARGRAPWYARLPATLRLLRSRRVRQAFGRCLLAVERRMPVSERCLSLLRKCQPDILLVSPLVEIGSTQGDYLRAADELGIPTGLVVASWDNLTTKGVIRDPPDLTIVWNEDQVREAIEFHHLPAGSVVATGAHSHDHWFSWRPSMSREDFSAKVGFAPDRRFLLYVCSSGFIAGDSEVGFVHEWLGRLGASGDPDLESLGVIVRPHPQNVGSWREADLDKPGHVVVWPRDGAAPTHRQNKEDYFHSLYNAVAVVGINTTALVDSAIVRRPVLTLVGDQFRGTQTGTLHFSYLARKEGNGLVSVAHSWEEHLDQLGSTVRSPDECRAQIDSFLKGFVRPHGLEQPAAPLAIDAVERVASLEKEAVPSGDIVRSAIGVVASALGRAHRARVRIARNARKRLGRRAARKRLRRWRKVARRRWKRARRRFAPSRTAGRRRRDTSRK